MVAYTKPQQRKKEESEQLRGESPWGCNKQHIINCKFLLSDGFCQFIDLSQK